MQPLNMSTNTEQKGERTAVNQGDNHQNGNVNGVYMSVLGAGSFRTCKCRPPHGISQVWSARNEATEAFGNVQMLGMQVWPLPCALLPPLGANTSSQEDSR